MNFTSSMNRLSLFRRIVSSFIAFSFVFTSIIPPSFAQTFSTNILNLPTPGVMVPLTQGYQPLMMRGVTIHPDDPFKFSFIMNSGDSGLEGDEYVKEARKVIKYFLASLTIPKEDMWVNLSPYEEERIIPNTFGQTAMGRDLLAQDYMLKQLTASLMYPEDELGNEFWNRVRAKAKKLYGTTEIPMNTFNKVWIVPDEAVIYEKDTSAFVIKSHLKVMMEEDYLALKKNMDSTKYGTNELVKDDVEVISGVTSQMIDELLIPEIEKEVNEGKTFANLRQIIDAVILGAWYKHNLRKTIFGHMYVDKVATGGVDVQDKAINQKIYEQYLEAFKVGVYDYIREDYDPVSDDMVPRKYFSGGTGASVTLEEGDPGADVVAKVVTEETMDDDDRDNAAKRAGGDNREVDADITPKGDPMRWSGKGFEDLERDVVWEAIQELTVPDGEKQFRILRRSGSYYQALDPNQKGKTGEGEGILKKNGIQIVVSKDGALEDKIFKVGRNKGMTDDEIKALIADIASAAFVVEGTGEIWMDGKWYPDIADQDLDFRRGWAMHEYGTIANPTWSEEQVQKKYPLPRTMNGYGPFRGDTHAPITYNGIFPDAVDDLLPRALLEDGDAFAKSIYGGKGYSLGFMSDLEGSGYFQQYKEQNLGDLIDELIAMNEDLQEELEQLLGDGKIDKITFDGFTREQIAQALEDADIRVPRGYTISTEQSYKWWQNDQEFDQEQIDEFMKALRLYEEAEGVKLGELNEFGDPNTIAVRSGAPESMAGMMDTILNLGLTLENVERWAADPRSDNRFVWDTYRRFIESYVHSVIDLNEEQEEEFAKIRDDMVAKRGAELHSQLPLEDYRELVDLYLAKLEDFGGKEKGFYVPQDPYEQYIKAITAVMRSTFNERAFVLRESEGFRLEDTISAVNIVGMRYGNKPGDSGTMVLFTRDAKNGANKVMAEYLAGAQGEDVVSGDSTPPPFAALVNDNPRIAIQAFAQGKAIESKQGQPQDLEMTWQDGVLYSLQSRRLKMVAIAEIRIALDMYKEGLLKSMDEVLDFVNPANLESILAPQFDPQAKEDAIKAGLRLSSKGLPASPGAASGRLVLDSNQAYIRAAELEADGKAIGDRIKGREAEFKVILVREETNQNDIKGMYAAAGIMTARGGTTSHAAVVARGKGKPATVAISNMEVHKDHLVFKIDGKPDVIVKEGDIISFDGSTGEVFLGPIQTIDSVVDVMQDYSAVESGYIQQLIDNNKLLIAWARKQGDTPEMQAYIAEKEAYIKEYTEVYLQKAVENRAKLSDADVEFYKEYQELFDYAGQKMKLGVYTNAEESLDTIKSVLNEVEGIGLARTEHMFLKDGRQAPLLKMVFAGALEKEDGLPDPEATQKQLVEALAALKIFQQSDFEEIFQIVGLNTEKPFPAIVRLLDPPLHELLPTEDEDIAKAAELMGMDEAEFRRFMDKLREEDPMLGLRGARLSILYPQIIEMQAEAIFEAKLKVEQELEGVKIYPEIMVPLIGNAEELEIVRAAIAKVAERLGIPENEYEIGTMAELVAAALNIDDVAAVAEFISIGSNDLTQGSLFFSREDGADWLERALEIKIFESSPFENLDPDTAEFAYRILEGAKKLCSSVGVCGEHGGDPKSVVKFALMGLSYVSASPRRIAAVRVALAKLQLQIERGEYLEFPAKQRREVQIPDREYVTAEEITLLDTLDAQLQAAVEYIGEFTEEDLANNPEMQERAETALQSLDLSLPYNGKDINEDPNAQKLWQWANQIQARMVVTNIRTADEFGIEDSLEFADGLGMFTTEKYFENSNFRGLFQLYLVSRDEEYRRAILQEIEDKIAISFQTDTIRDPKVINDQLVVRLPNFPFQELFQEEVGVTELAETLQAILEDVEPGITTEEVIQRIEFFNETNPRMGVRGTRALIMNEGNRQLAPIYMSIVRALAYASQKVGYTGLEFVLPHVTKAKEITVARRGHVSFQGKELAPSLELAAYEGILKAEELDAPEGEFVRNRIADAQNKIKTELDIDDPLSVGTIIEVPALAINAEHAADVSTGSIIIDARGLLEATWGISKKDIDPKEGFRPNILRLYTDEERQIWENDIYILKPKDVKKLIQEALADLLVTHPNKNVYLRVNPEDDALISMADSLEIDGIIVDKDQGLKGVLAAAKSSLTSGDAVVFDPNDTPPAAPDRGGSPSGEVEITGGEPAVVGAAPAGASTGVRDSEASTGAFGGIDINTDFINQQIIRDPNGVPLPMLQQPAPITNIIIDGVEINILNISVFNMPLMLGLTDVDDSDQEANFNEIDPLDRKARFELESDVDQVSYLN